MTAARVRTQTEHRIRLVTLDRPERRNALDRQAVVELADALAAADADPAVGAVVLMATPPVFSAGADLDELADAVAGSGSVLGPEHERLFDTLADLSVPLVAAVDGPAVGLGAVVLLYCDAVFASSTARFRFPFVALGVTTEGGVSSLLPRLIGDQAAARVLLTAGWVGAAEAEHLGLVTSVASEGDGRDEAIAFATQVAVQPREAVRATKRLLGAERLVAARRGRVAEQAEWAHLQHGGPKDPRRADG